MGNFKLSRFVDSHRALLMLIVVFVGLSLTAPNFLNSYNLTTILKSASLYSVVMIGFALIFIIGELDLSVGAIVMLAGMLAIGLEPSLGWYGSFAAATLAGILVGLVNGLLVAKGKIHSFIVTLGMMSIVLGLMHIYSGGDSLSTEDYDLSDWLDEAKIELLPPIVIITLCLVLGANFFFNKTRLGRGFFVVGGNKETAWLAGLNKDRYIVLAFVISGMLSAVGGALFSMSLAAMPANVNLANNTLMAVLAATIIGGTLMSGGKGNILKCYFAVLLLSTIFNGISLFGYSYDIQIFVNGVILALVVLYESYAVYKQDALKGQNPKLLQSMLRSRER